MAVGVHRTMSCKVGRIVTAVEGYSSERGSGRQHLSRLRLKKVVEEEEEEEEDDAWRQKA